MPRDHSGREGGQAIVLIALTLAVLLAFLALAVDGGNMYVHRRLVQNATDSGALGGTLRILADFATDDQVRGTILDRVAENGVDLDAEGTVVHAWYVNQQGYRISDTEVGLWGFIPMEQGAAGVEVQVDVEFDAFVAQLIGLSRLSASSDSGAVISWPNFCGDYALYANCDEGQGNCYNSALNLSGSMTSISGGGIHSNSGLHTTGSVFLLDSDLAEWGTPGICTGNACPPDGVAEQVAPRAMPRLYEWEDFQPGGYWWNKMCQGESGEQCHTSGSIGANQTIEEGLWVINGDLHSPRVVPGDTHFTFVLNGDFSFNGQQPNWEPFIGSDPEGGSKAFIFSTAPDPRGVGISARVLNWQGVIYVPNGLASISASEDMSADGTIFAWRIDLSGSNITIEHDDYYCPPRQPNVRLLW